MDSVVQPILALCDELSWFARDKTLRLMHVHADGSLRGAALAAVGDLARHPDNTAPVVVLEQPSWAARTETLVQAHAARENACMKLGIPCPPLETFTSGPTPVTRFGELLRRFAAIQTQRMKGAIVALAPTEITDPKALVQEVSSLVGSPALSDVRWVVVDVGGSLLDLPRALGTAGLAVECRVDDAAVAAEIAAMAAAGASAPEGSTGPALVGAAWPSVAPPRRDPPRASSREIAETLGSKGIEAPPDIDSSQKLRVTLQRLIVAMRESRGPDAVRHVREARELCVKAQRFREAITLQVLLASILLRFEQRKAAIDAYVAGSETGERTGHLDLAAQAMVGCAGAHIADGRRADAIGAYARAGELARRAGAVRLAVEAFAICGSFCVDAGLEQEAVRVWKIAVEIGQQAPIEEIAASSAADVARKLAKLCRKHRLGAQATALEAQARVFDGLRPPPEPSVEDVVAAAAAMPAPRVVEHELTDLVERVSSSIAEIDESEESVAPVSTKAAIDELTEIVERKPAVPRQLVTAPSRTDDDEVAEIFERDTSGAAIPTAKAPEAPTPAVNAADVVTMINEALGRGQSPRPVAADPDEVTELFERADVARAKTVMP